VILRKTECIADEAKDSLNNSGSTVPEKYGTVFQYNASVVFENKLLAHNRKSVVDKGNDCILR
jgi:hypothetical protein